MRIIGLDLSLTSTGLADAGQQWTHVLKPGKRTGFDRLRFLRFQILDYCASADLVIVEGPSYGSVGEKGHHERGGLWWMVTEAIDAEGAPLAIAAPSALKKYATGKGNAGKDDVLIATSRRFDWFAGRNDEADALWLSALGYELAGAPCIDLPATHRTVLAKVEWPAPAPAAA